MNLWNDFDHMLDQIRRWTNKNLSLDRQPFPSYKKPPLQKRQLTKMTLSLTKKTLDRFPASAYKSAHDDDLIFSSGRNSQREDLNSQDPDSPSSSPQGGSQCTWKILDSSLNALEVRLFLQTTFLNTSLTRSDRVIGFRQ